MQIQSGQTVPLRAGGECAEWKQVHNKKKHHTKRRNVTLSTVEENKKNCASTSQILAKYTWRRFVMKYE
jgi:hypothetical protein